MFRLTFVDEKNQRKILGDAHDLGELYSVMFIHARRLFIHPTLIKPGDLSEPKSCYIVGKTKTCSYELENIGA